MTPIESTVPNSLAGIAFRAAVCLVTCAGAFAATPSHAATAVVSFDRSLSPGVVGYKIYYGTAPGNYRQTIDIGDVQHYEVAGLENGKSYYFAITAYDQGGHESDLSDEHVVTVPGDATIANDAANAPSISTVYEDAEDGRVDGWLPYGKEAAAAIVSNVFDAQSGSRVIDLAGAGSDTGFRLGNGSATWDSDWTNSKQFIARWDMRFNEPFLVFVDVETTAGQRYLLYTPVGYDNLGNGQHVHHGVGAAASNGQWIHIERDLRADLEEAQPAVRLLTVNAFLVRGSGRLDNILLADDRRPAASSAQIAYEDAEDGCTSRWLPYGEGADSAEVTNLFDAQKNSRVIQLNGTGSKTGYRLGQGVAAGWEIRWENKDYPILEWHMQYNEPFVIYIDVQTSVGHRYLLYTPVDYNNLGTGETIHHGVGAASSSGSWTHRVRDLRADLQDAQPEAQLLQVDAFLIRGSGRVDDIILRSAP